LQLEIICLKAVENGLIELDRADCRRVQFLLPWHSGILIHRDSSFDMRARCHILQIDGKLRAQPAMFMINFGP